MKQENNAEPFQFSPGNYPPGEDRFSNDLLEQYKIACTAADNVSSRRESSNRYLITLNTAIVALYGLQAAGEANPYLLIPLAVVGLAVSILSRGIISSHRKLNQAKFDIILEVEKHLPVRMYAAEWNLFKERAKRLETSRLEEYIHWLFGAIHIAAPTLIIIL